MSDDLIYGKCTPAQRDALMAAAAQAKETPDQKPMGGRTASAIDTGIGFLIPKSLRSFTDGGEVGDANRIIGDVNKVTGGAREQQAIASLNPNSECDQHGNLKPVETPSLGDKVKGLFNFGGR
jgi:hypothetical protein